MQWLIDTLIWLPDMLLEWLKYILIWTSASLIALTFHEFAHGLVADLLGDRTPYHQGRLTLNPLPHLDWIGFIMLIIFKFGWAKPVMVDPRNFKGVSMKTGMMLVALAGPAMNILLALLGALAHTWLIPYQSGQMVALLIELLDFLVYINLILAAFNLIPVPPLDGSKIIAGLLPNSGAQFIYSMEQYGPLILLLLIVTNTAGKIIGPVYNFLAAILLTVI